MSFHAHKQVFLSMLIIGCSLLFAFSTAALPKVKRKPPPPSALDSYLTTARAMNLPAPATIGSLWVASGPLATLSADYKARNPGDTLLIHLADNFSAVSTGENKQSRQFTTNSAVTGLLGTLATKNRLQ